jgi:hypothetical protein
MSSRDVSTVTIMRVRPFIIALVCVGLVWLFSAAAEAKDESGSKTIAVDCGKGGSINNALKDTASKLIIQIRGVCHEDVVIARDDVTLRGVDPDATVVAQANQAIRIDRASRVTLEDLKVTGSTKPALPGAGIFLFHSSGVVLSNVKAEGNREGMRTYGSTLRVVDSDFCRNSAGGLYLAGGSSLFIDGAEINTSENGNYGFLVSESTVRVNWPSIPRVVANDNGGAGVALQGTADVLLAGSFEAKRNGTGIQAVGGELAQQGNPYVDISENGDGVFVFGEAVIDLGGGEGVSVSKNSGTGLVAIEGAYIRFNGTLERNGLAVNVGEASRVSLDDTVCQNNGFGVYVHGGSAWIGASTIQGNTSTGGCDVGLVFGAMASFGGANSVGTVCCDETVLVEGDVGCPTTTSVTVSPLQIGRVAPKTRQPDAPKPPRWIP